MLHILFCRLTHLWQWTQTVMLMKRWPRRAGMGRMDPLLAAPMKMPPSIVPLFKLFLHPAPHLALRPGQALPRVWTLFHYRRLVRGPAPYPHPAPGPSQTMTGPIIPLSAQQSASTQECRETKVFTLIHAVTSVMEHTNIV